MKIGESKVACLFLRNVPLVVPGTAYYTEFDQNAVIDLHRDLKELLGSEMEIHWELTQYRMLRPDGYVSINHGVHGFIEWHSGRNVEIKQIIATRLQKFLDFHGIGKGFDLTFRDYPSETFFFEGELVKGGLPGT